MRDLDYREIELVGGAASGIWDEISAVTTAAVAGSLVRLPGPASGPLGVFAGVTGHMTAGAGYMGSITK